LACWIGHNSNKRIDLGKKFRTSAYQGEAITTAGVGILSLLIISKLLPIRSTRGNQLIIQIEAMGEEAGL
jgi:hypothetical protein